ncbi:hypothetical protein CVIRNUC_000074 [Coccomyxa viridis]|uniref:Orn/DAP/Arg decarboxylase 2 N-terminal domain-containing protein n=1 Tax=Coccomyxa viridis TaxID=1274662 RepID=A0AAV1HP74_9CHLO|nr:hypothetical protein CVIRNUC_000074 [Coccomyxa viridis]
MQSAADDPSNSRATDEPAAAKEVGAAVRGVSFHVGSGATNLEAFRKAIQLLRDAFDVGTELGFQMDLLNIGCGSCSAAGSPGSVPAAVNSALAGHILASLGAQIIAEPGRCSAESTATLACMAFGVRNSAPADAAPTRDF